MRLEPSMAESVAKVLEIQDLMLTPEAKQLHSLDNDMQQILQDKGLGLSEKIQKFELKLGKFRHVQEKIIEQGTTSLADRFRNDSWKEEMRDVLQTMLDETIQKHLQNQTATLSLIGADNQSDQSSSITGTAYGTPAAEAVPARQRGDTLKDSPSDQDDSLQLLPESPPSQIYLNNENTPANTNQQDLLSTPTKELQQLWSLLEGHLKSGGMKNHNGRYLFPIIDSATRIRLKKQHYDYAPSTLQKVLTVLTSTSAQNIPGNASRLVDCLKKLLSPARANFVKYYPEYPNLENMLNRSQIINVSNWSTCDTSTPKQTTKQRM